MKDTHNNTNRVCTLITKIPIIPYPDNNSPIHSERTSANYKECKKALIEDFSSQVTHPPMNTAIDIRLSITTKEKRQCILSRLARTIEDSLEGIIYFDSIQVVETKVNHKLGRNDVAYVEIIPAISSDSYIDKVSRYKYSK